VQGRYENKRYLLDAESIAGHLLKPGSVFAFPVEYQRDCSRIRGLPILFPSARGRPSVPAEVSATVIVVQALHGLPGVQTVDTMTHELQWRQHAAPVRAVAFHSTTLTPGVIGWPGRAH
jgi:hypothetical protein